MVKPDLFGPPITPRAGRPHKIASGGTKSALKGRIVLICGILGSSRMIRFERIPARAGTNGPPYVGGIRGYPWIVMHDKNSGTIEQPLDITAQCFPETIGI
jgi:hypothetical protein